MGFDYPRIIRTLVEHDVAFVLIGGVAVNVRGSATATFDLDICDARDPDSCERLAVALRTVNARLRGVDGEVPFQLDARTLRSGDSFTFETDHGPFDVLATPFGTSGYDDLVRGATLVDLGGVDVRVVGLDDLIG